MTDALILLGMIALVGAVVVLLDWLGQRQERPSKHHPTA
jgi:hypothetical protein